MTDPWPGGTPFAGITTRTYNQATIDHTTWDTTPPQPLDLRELWLTQNKLTATAMFGLDTYSTDHIPRVVHHNGIYQLEDGHHRIVRAALRGHTTHPVRIHRIP